MSKVCDAVLVYLLETLMYGFLAFLSFITSDFILFKVDVRISLLYSRLSMLLFEHNFLFYQLFHRYISLFLSVF